MILSPNTFTRADAGKQLRYAVDAVGFVHAMLPRIQALLLPVKTLVLSGH